MIYVQIWYCELLNPDLKSEFTHYLTSSSRSLTSRRSMRLYSWREERICLRSTSVRLRWLETDLRSSGTRSQLYSVPGSSLSLRLRLLLLSSLPSMWPHQYNMRWQLLGRMLKWSKSSNNHIEFAAIFTRNRSLYGTASFQPRSPHVWPLALYDKY